MVIRPQTEDSRTPQQKIKIFKLGGGFAFVRGGEKIRLRGVGTFVDFVKEEKTTTKEGGRRDVLTKGESNQEYPAQCYTKSKKPQKGGESRPPYMSIRSRGDSSWENKVEKMRQVEKN